MHKYFFYNFQSYLSFPIRHWRIERIVDLEIIIKFIYSNAIYNYILFPIWLIILTFYIVDIILQFLLDKKSLKQMSVCLPFSITFMILLFYTNFINAVVFLSILIFVISTYILPFIGIKKYKLNVVIKGVLKWLRLRFNNKSRKDKL